MNKKGFDVQFNWIFIMIAGALILAFFFGLANKQKNLSTQKLQATLASDIDGILVGALISKGVAQSLPVPSQGLALSCSKGCNCKIGIGSATQSFENKPIFAPSKLKNRPAMVWSLDWKLPYRVTNFLYITSPDVKYVLVYNENDAISRQLFDQITKNAPPAIIKNGQVVTKIVFENLTSSEAKSYEQDDETHTKFVFLKVQPPSNFENSFGSKGASVLVVKTSSVEFWSVKGKKVRQSAAPLAYAGLPTLYAAIFSQDSAMYECGLKSAFRRMSYLSSLYRTRASRLQEIFGSDRCNYDLLSDMLEEQEVLSGSLWKGLDQSDMARLSAQQGLISRSNRQLVEKSCPELF